MKLLEKLLNNHNMNEADLRVYKNKVRVGWMD